MHIALQIRVSASEDSMNPTIRRTINTKIELDVSLIWLEMQFAPKATNTQIADAAEKKSTERFITLF